MKKSEMKGITRIDQEEKYNHGWFARVLYREKKRVGWFPDKKHGGKMRALIAAKRFVEKAHKDLNKPYTARRVVTVPMSATRVLGVSRDRSGFLVSHSSKKGKNERVYVPKRQGLKRAARIRRVLRDQMYRNAAISHQGG